MIGAWLATGLVLLSVISLLFTLVTHAAAWRVLRRRPPQRGPTPPISILKPLKGLDDGLYENLASFAQQRYPNFEMLLGVDSPDDPALRVALAAKAAFPHVPISVHVCRTQIGRNPKVNTLAALSAHARYEHLLVSDSNVRVREGYLLATAAEQADPRVGLVTNPVAGVGGQTVAAVLENWHLNSFVVGGVCAAQLLASHPCVLGKSMLFRRRDLEAVGGWRSVRNVLAEDYVLGRRFEAAGLRIALSPHVVTTANETWGMRLFLGRHLRWAQMRRRISPATYAGEPLVNPVLWSLSTVAVMALSEGPFGSAAPLAAAAAVVKVASDALLARRLRGSGRFSDVAWIPVKDLAIAAVWIVAGFRRTVEWRGTRLVIGPGSRILAARPSPRRRFRGLHPEAGMRKTTFLGSALAAMMLWAGPAASQPATVTARSGIAAAEQPLVLPASRTAERSRHAASAGHPGRGVGALALPPPAAAARQTEQ